MNLFSFFFCIFLFCYLGGGIFGILSELDVIAYFKIKSYFLKVLGFDLLRINVQFLFAQSAGAVKYTDCFSAEG